MMEDRSEEMKAADKGVEACRAKTSWREPTLTCQTRLASRDRESAPFRRDFIPHKLPYIGLQIRALCHGSHHFMH